MKIKHFWHTATLFVHSCTFISLLAELWPQNCQGKQFWGLFIFSLDLWGGLFSALDSHQLHYFSHSHMFTPCPFLDHGLHPSGLGGLDWLRWEIISVPFFSLLGWAQCAVLTACWWVSWFRDPCCGLYSWSEGHQHQVSFDCVIFKNLFFFAVLI